MKTVFLSFILFLITAVSFAQIKFEKGYFIDNDNRKIECFIKNYDWRCNPNKFEYKTEDNDSTLNGNILSAKEFGIYGYSKYIRANINIDRSSKDIEKLSNQKKPIWSKEQLFLKVLIEGKASLYLYEDEKFRRFFYSISDTLIQQLIYKSYLDDDGNIAINFGFRQQLWNDIRCANSTINSIEHIDYFQNELERYFKNYNQCIGESFVDYSIKPQRDIFNLKIAAGINYSSLSYSNSQTGDNIIFNNNISYRIGVEAEFILPFNRNKWGIIFEPTYQYFNSEKKIYFYEMAIIKYGSLEFPIGVRYYFFINENLSIFLNGFYISNFCLNFNPTINYSDSSPLDIKPSNCFAVGGGINYKSISIEMRYYTSKDLLNNYVSWSADYQRFSVIIGYKLLKARHNNGS